MGIIAKSGKGIYSPSEMRGATLFAKLIGALTVGPPRSYDELAEYVGLHVHTVRRYVLALREHEPRLVRIAEWQEDRLGISSIRCFEMGCKPDEPRPKQSNAERQRRQNLKKKERRRHQAIAGPLKS